MHLGCCWGVASERLVPESWVPYVCYQWYLVQLRFGIVMIAWQGHWNANIPLVSVQKNQSKKCRHKADSIGAFVFSYFSSSYFYKIIVSMSAARSTNLESILIFATCVLHRSLDFIKFTDRQDLEKYFFLYVSLLIPCMIKCLIGNKSVYRLCVNNKHTIEDYMAS